MDDGCKYESGFYIPENLSSLLGQRKRNVIYIYIATFLIIQI